MTQTRTPKTPKGDMPDFIEVVEEITSTPQLLLGVAAGCIIGAVVIYAVIQGRQNGVNAPVLARWSGPIEIEDAGAPSSGEPFVDTRPEWMRQTVGG